MILEHRVYTMRPGNLEAFVQAQIDRGFDLMEPLIHNCVGYFATIAGTANQMVHLWAFDDLEDWRARYNAVYAVPELQPYFATVRPLMLAQEVKMLIPAPLAELTPLWGEGRDWRAGDTVIGDLAVAPKTIVEEQTLSLLPGSLPKYWEAYAKHGIEALEPLADRLIGCFFTLIGPLHQVVHLWRFDDYADRDHRHAEVAAHDGWRVYSELVKPMAVGQKIRLTRPVNVAPMSPLFKTG